MLLRQTLFLGLAFLSVLVPSMACSAKSVPVTITLQPTTRQTFVGFGTSEMNVEGRFQQLPGTTRDVLAKMVWQDLNFKIMRVWFSPSVYLADPKSPNISDFVRRYVSSGIITTAKNRGCTTLLLAPDDVPASFGKPKTSSSAQYTEFTETGVTAYAELIASFILQVRSQAGVQINATGILNEPNDRPIRFSLAQWPTVVKALRASLDARGLKDVAIVTPEAASCDGTAFDMVNAIKNDSAAWSAMKGIATHTYNMGATDSMAQKVLGTSKWYWQTESSTPGPEALGDVLNAASSAGRIVSDLNHGVTHWIWFIGYEQNDPADNGTRLIRYDVTKAGGDIQKFYKYYYIQQLSQAFAPGTKMLPCVSATEGTMTWTYGIKPSLIAAGSKNADGTWSVALLNYTSTKFSTLSDWDRSQGGKTSQTFNVTLKIDGLAKVSTSTFNVRRSTSTKANVSSGTVKASKGVLSITVNPLELVTLTGR